MQEYQKTNYFLLSIDSVGRQKYILPGKFSSYLFFKRPIIGFSNKDSALEYYINNNRLGLFIDIEEKIENNIKKIEKLFTKDEKFYENQYNNAQNIYNNYFSSEYVEEQIKKIFI